MGASRVYPVTGQTYSRKIDAQVLSVLSGIGISAHKAGNDIRILQHRKEVEEPFGAQQVGSSAMAYKRNPMRSERMCSLSRFAISLADSASDTAATQWMERTLDDSANRRLVLPQAFLAIDAVLILYRNIVEGLVVYPHVIARRLNEELPMMATEEILMAGVRAGGDRQELHEAIRVHSQAAGDEVKLRGGENDLIARLQADPKFADVDLDVALDARGFIGRAAEQVDEFLSQVIEPIRDRYRSALDADAGEVTV
jgi:adenylosuccinate lyase